MPSNTGNINQTGIASGALATADIFVTLDASDEVVASGDGARAIGVLQTTAADQGDAVTYTTSGFVDVLAQAVVAVGSPVMSDLNGNAIAAATATKFALGIVVGQATAVGVVSRIYLQTSVAVPA